MEGNFSAKFPSSQKALLLCKDAIYLRGEEETQQRDKKQDKREVWIKGREKKVKKKRSGKALKEEPGERQGGTVNCSNKHFIASTRKFLEL